MSQYVELPDTVYNALQRLAEREGTTPAEWIARNLPALPQNHDAPTTAHPLSSEQTSSNASPNAWEVLDTLAGTVDAPEDWSIEHDRYILGEI